MRIETHHFPTNSSQTMNSQSVSQSISPSLLFGQTGVSSILNRSLCAPASIWFRLADPRPKTGVRAQRTRARLKVSESVSGRTHGLQQRAWEKEEDSRRHFHRTGFESIYQCLERRECRNKDVQVLRRSAPLRASLRFWARWSAALLKRSLLRLLLPSPTSTPPPLTLPSPWTGNK